MHALLDGITLGSQAGIGGSVSLESGAATLQKAIAEAREHLAGSDDAHTRAYLRLLDQLLEQFEADRQDAAEDCFAQSLTAILGADPERRADLADAVGSLAFIVAPDDDPPATPDGAAAFRTLVGSADRLYGAGVVPLGRLPFISDRLLRLMVDEAGLELPDRVDSGQRLNAPPGRALATLAVSRKLLHAMESALGLELAPARLATYMYDPPGSHVRTHLDNRPYEAIFHMVLEHEVPGDGSPGSALVAHVPGRSEPVRVWLRPGEAVALSGRGTIHSWQQLAADERRTLIGIGFERVV